MFCSFCECAVSWGKQEAANSFVFAVLVSFFLWLSVSLFKFFMVFICLLAVLIKTVLEIGCLICNAFQPVVHEVTYTSLFPVLLFFIETSCYSQF